MGIGTGEISNFKVRKKKVTLVKRSTTGVSLFISIQELAVTLTFFLSHDRQIIKKKPEGSGQ